MLARRTAVALACLIVGGATNAGAQMTTPAGGDQPGVVMRNGDTVRPATTTFLGDTGLWFVPTGEILPHGRWSVSGYRVNWDREQGFTDVSYFPITFGVGIRDRVELFGSIRPIVRIDRDRRPLFGGEGDRSAGVVTEYPFVTQGWTGNDFSDAYVGAKFNVLAEHREEPVGFTFRAMVKIPTGDDDAGASTGKADFHVDGILSKEVNQRADLAFRGGVVLRGDPSGVDLPHGFTWGVGAGFPSRRALRVTAELHGEQPFDDTVVLDGVTLVGEDGSVAPRVTIFDAPVNASIGLTWQHASGFFVGSGLNWSIRHKGRSRFGSFDDETGDSLGFQFRLGYHPGVRVFAPPPPPPPPPANRPPTVKAQCNPCTVEIGKTSTVTAEAQDPDGDPLTYRWSAPTGSFATPTERQTIWTAPMEPGPVPVTVTVDDGRGGTANDTVTIQVVRPAVREFVFEDVHFDFDRYSLRPEATRILDEVLKAMQENPTLRIQVEGHTCNIGTAEYNLALGERRANAVRDYLMSRGIAANRLETVSYGEERPKHDNSREETRRLNRRAAMVVRMTQ
jgi:peptidoglycan-associated lipoprotein